jgi:MoaA/NifB/PqqE/SkfB family radical SAM enzyme
MPFQPVLARGGADRGLAIDAAAWPALWAELRRLREAHGLYFEMPSDEVGDPGCAQGAPCMAAFSHLVVDPDLRVRPCDRLVGEVMGDLRRETLAEIWSSAAALGVVSRALPLCESALRQGSTPDGPAKRRRPPLRAAAS